jgi:hypothetical protein
MMVFFPVCFAFFLNLQIPSFSDRERWLLFRMLHHINIIAIFKYDGTFKKKLLSQNDSYGPVFHLHKPVQIFF